MTATLAMDDLFTSIASGRKLPSQQGLQLTEHGFMVAPRVFSARKLVELTSAYDEVMMQGSGPDFKVASATTRMFDLVNRGPAFDAIYVHSLLLEASAYVMGEPFKLSSLLC
jgi:hypothetical protein